MPLDLTWTRQIPQGRLVVHAGRLIDGLQPTPRAEMDIVIEKHRIVAIEPHRSGLHTGRVIDASGHSVMPGLIDGHVHMSTSWGTRFGRIHLAYGTSRPSGIRARFRNEMLEQREAIAAGRRSGAAGSSGPAPYSTPGQGGPFS